MPVLSLQALSGRGHESRGRPNRQPQGSQGPLAVESQVAVGGRLCERARAAQARPECHQGRAGELAQNGRQQSDPTDEEPAELSQRPGAPFRKLQSTIRHPPIGSTSWPVESAPLQSIPAAAAAATLFQSPKSPAVRNRYQIPSAAAAAAPSNAPASAPTLSPEPLRAFNRSESSLSYPARAA